MSANSAVYKIKNSGPRTEPCGTEHMMWMTTTGEDLQKARKFGLEAKAKA